MTPQALARIADGASRARLRVVGQAEAHAAGLIERAVELDVLRRAVARLGEGEGGVVVLEAGAGLGKTALLEHAAGLAAEAGCALRRAAPGPLERHFPFGVVRALLEAPLRSLPAADRAGLLDGASAPASALLLHGAVPRDDSTMTIAHSVLWLCSTIASERPLALVVDDAQWADRQSLEVLAYLARRIADVPVLLVVAARAGDPEAASDLLSLVAAAPAATLLEPRALSAAGTVQLVRRLAPDTTYERCREYHRAATGNPWLLGELAAGDDRDALSPDARGVVGQRLAALGSHDRTVAGALAVLGDGARPHIVAAVAGIPLAELYAARERLRAAGLLATDDDRFAHGLIAAAVADGLPHSERARLHGEAARALLADGVADRVVACHLLEAAPAGDPEASAVLVRAADEAAAAAAPQTAVRYLERALGERAGGDDRGRMLSKLGSLAFDAGMPDSRDRLREALREASGRDSRVDVLTRLATLQALDSADTELAELLREELANEPDPQVRVAFDAASLDALMMLPDRHEERARRAAQIDLDGVADSGLRRAVLAHRAWIATELGSGGAEAAAATALEALEGDDLLRDASKRAGYHLCVRTLIFADRAADAHAAIVRLRDEADARGSLRLRATASWHAAELARRTGRVADAENEARTAFALVDDGMNVVSGGAADILVWALAERGAFGEARDFLRENGLDGPLGGMVWEIGVVHARARLALAEGDFERARKEACAAGALREEQGRPNPTWTPWGSTVALALAHVGRREAAASMAEAELSRAERFGAPVPIVAALHARAVAEPDDERRAALCERALDLAAGGAAPLEAVRVRLELGSTLARMGRRTEARDALRPALAAADAAGAVLLAERARRELVATGLRPRKAALSGPQALTPRQRQVCELAAAGKGNRAIAQALFLSIKTVETHLAAGYRKLGVSSRDGIRAQLAA